MAAGEPKEQKFRTRLSHHGRAGTKVHGFVNPPLMRGSTVLYPSMKERRAAAGKRLEQALVYGIMGSETHFALEDMIAEIEGGTRCQIVGSGLAAVTTPLLAYLKAGDHCLMPDSVYGPARNFCTHFLTGYGVETTFYLPEIDHDAISDLIRPNTRVVYVESPGSHTFEVQDVPAIARAAHRKRRARADGQHLGLPLLPAVRPRGRRVDPGAHQIRRRPFRPDAGQRDGEHRRGLGAGARHLAAARAVCEPRRLLAGAARTAHPGGPAGCSRCSRA